MTNRELAEALRVLKDECIPPLASACADALANSETHILALQQEVEKMRHVAEMANKERDVVMERMLKMIDERIELRKQLEAAQH